MNSYNVKDSGVRQDYESGMRRDTQEGKVRYDLIYMPMIERLAWHYTNGAVKYGDNNWQLADSEEEMKRFKQSAIRHFFQWFNGDGDEDHASAAYFNICAAEMVKEKLNEK